jgi:hypothetical protein
MPSKAKEKDAKAKTYFAKRMPKMVQESADVQGRPEDKEAAAEALLEVVPDPDALSRR